MSWDYLQGKTWAQITRDERFFCQHLYHLILRERGVNFFVEKLNELTELTGHKLNLDATANWEIGYEVCFYRDLWFLRGKKEPLHSPKRTFDLCLFSAETIVIIEAKAQQGFDSDSPQKGYFKADKTLVKAETKVKHVKLLGLASSHYLKKMNLDSTASQDVLFDGLISWEQLNDHMGPDEILKRADDIYGSGGSNNEKYMILGEIFEVIGQGKKLYIGCKGGLPQFMETYRHDPLRRYETSTLPVENKNWFTSDKVIL